MAQSEKIIRYRDNEEMLQDEVLTRAMQQHDVPAVMEIERASYSFPWSEKIIRDCVRVGFHCWIIQRIYETAGFAIASRSKGDYHILNLCVAPWARRQGFASRLLGVLLAEARLIRAERATLEVRESNLKAQTLYHFYGFSEVERRAAYYQGVYDGEGKLKDKDNREDALVYAINL